MGKFLRIVIVGGALVMVVAGALVWYVFSNLDAIVKRTVERVGSETTGTAVTLDGVRISLRSTEGALDGLRIANPDGFRSINAFEFDEILMNLDVSSLRSDEIVVREVHVQGARLTFEQQGDRNNLRTLLDNVERAAEEESSGGDAAEDETRMVIEEFVLSRSAVTLIHDRLEEDLSFELPEIRLTDIGRVGAGETVESAAKQILEPVLEQTMDAAQQRARTMLEQRLDQELDKHKQNALDSLKKKVLGND